MAEFPALPLFTDAFIADTMHLNSSQTGAYLMLLMAAWRSPDCKLFDDDKMLARMARMDGRAWSANKVIIMQFWRRDDAQKWYQRRLLDERKYVDDIRRKNAEAGKASALKRKDRHSTTVSTETQPISNPHTPPTPTPKKISSKENIRPSDISEQVWQDFKTHRKARRSPITETALKKIRTEAEKANLTIQQAIEYSISRGWQGFEAEWYLKGNNNVNRTEREPTGHAALAEVGRIARDRIEQDRLQGTVYKSPFDDYFTGEDVHPGDGKAD